MEIEKTWGALKGTSSVDSDGVFNKNRADHEEKYTKILESYVSYLEQNLKSKQKLKSSVFIFSFLSLVIFALLMAAVIIKECFFNEPNTLQILVSIVPAFASFLTIFMVMPKIITKYLFNSDEEKYISDIVKSIQDYDKRQSK